MAIFHFLHWDKHLYYQNYNFKHRFVPLDPITRYYINWPQEIDIPSELSEGRTFFTIRFNLRRALAELMITSTEPQFIDRRTKNCCIVNDLPKLKELETIEVIDSVDIKRDSQKSKCFSVRLFNKIISIKAPEQTFSSSHIQPFNYLITQLSIQIVYS
jgi:hypothetical protein